MKPRSTLHEIALALVVVSVFLGAIVGYARTWPPAVIVESGSMMHPDAVTSFGRVGTIDPGDVIVVRRVDGLDDVRLLANGGDERYGRAGDVIVFLKDGNPAGTPIIHRAVSFVEVSGEGPDRTYRVRWNGEWRSYGPEGIHLPELGFEAGPACCPDGYYRPRWSGFITQGDNAQTNPSTDQTLLIAPQPIKPEWVRGVARGEVPWLGLVKLALAPQPNPHEAGWLRVGNAHAPWDLWAMLVVSVGVALAAPVLVDVVRRRLVKAPDA